MFSPESERSRGRGTEDRLSSLPDELLHHVMLFMPAWQAVQLCVLSRRWKTLWTTMPNLNFDFRNLWNKLPDNKLPDNIRTSAARIVEFVNTVLLLRETPFSLQSFRFDIDRRYYFLCISLTTWLQYAVKHDLKALILNSSASTRILLPSEVFTCPSLEHVTFSFESGSCIDTTVIISLPSLKQLHLKTKILTQDFMSKLLGGCPVLEDLHMKVSCIWFSNIFSHSLKHLTITAGHYEWIKLIGFPNLLSLHLTMCSCCLQYGIILNMPSLLEACIDIHCCSGYGLVVNRVTKSKILCGLFNVHTLELRGTFIQDFLEAEISSCITYSNLTCLLVDNFCLKCHFDLLSSFLEYCPSLKKLSLVHRGCICEKQSIRCKPKKEAKFKYEKLETVEIKFLVEDNTSHWVLKCLQEAVTGLGDVRIIMTSDA